MKKFFTLIAAVALAASVNAQVLKFDQTYAKGSVPATFSADGLVLKVVDTDGKMAVDANSQYFGTAESYENFSYRLKSGGKSLTKNNLTLTVPSDGTLKVYVRTGSSSATDRNIVLTQNETELVNKILLESEAVTVSMTDDKGDTKDTKVFPVISVPVKQGDVAIKYPVNSVNFYGFELVKTSTGISSVNTAVAKKNGKTYNMAGQEVSSSAKGLIIKNGKKYVK